MKTYFITSEGHIFSCSTLSFIHIYLFDSFFLCLPQRNYNKQKLKEKNFFFFQENLEGLIEIHGFGQGRQVMCQSYVSFPMDYASTFGEYVRFCSRKTFNKFQYYMKITISIEKEENVLYVFHMQLKCTSQ